MSENKLFTDGGSRGNPGPAAIGFYLETPLENKEFGRYIGIKTNNEAEYFALIEGLQAAHSLKLNKLVCYLDSELVVNQLLGKYRVKNERLEPLYKQVKRLTGGFESIEFVHIKREKNKKADALVNIALDSQLGV